MNAPLTVGVLTRGVVPTDWAFSFRALRFPENTVFLQLPGLPYHHARNQLVQRMLKNGSKWIFFLDDDVLAPPDAFEKLSAVPCEIVSGLYYKRQGRITPTMYRDSSPHPQPIQIPSGGNPVFEVDYVGGGCLLVHRSVFERIKAPWFEWTVDREDLPVYRRMGEDFMFSEKARRAGLRIMAHTGVRCKHMGYGYSDEEGHFVPTPPTELL
jgi:GT2 family glycosyltransferase